MKEPFSIAQNPLPTKSPDTNLPGLQNLGVGGEELLHKNHSNAPAQNTAVVKKEKKKRQMREKLSQANEAVGGEITKVRVTTLHSVMCLPGRLC